MPSDSSFEARPAERERGAVRALLDPLFGFFVWAIHLMLVYCANALACARGIAPGSPAQGAFRMVLIGVTLTAIAIVAVHALRRWRTRSEETAFLRDLTIGNDAIAAAGIAMQLFPLLMLHPCR